MQLSCQNGISTRGTRGTRGTTTTKTYCASLNSARSNFTSCCSYPVFAMWTWQMKNCQRQCANVSAAEASCCQSRCTYVDQLNILSITSISDGSLAGVTMNQDAVSVAFLITVGNDTKWVPVVKQSVQTCYNELWLPSETITYDCNFQPSNFLPIIDCIYLTNFLHCPTWNPHNLDKCFYTKKYLEEC